MSAVELVWVQQCEVCGREHRHMETHGVMSHDEAAAEAGAFRARCEHWYQAHVAVLDARRPAASLR